MSDVLRIGIDLGGTKIAGIALLDPPRANGATNAEVVAEHRVPTPRDDYAGTVRTIADMVAQLRSGWPGEVTIGVGMPGSLSPKSGRVQNANSTWLNGRHLDSDLVAAVGQDVKCANDADCLALSECRDGAAAGASSVFGVILGTGCGGGLVHEGRLIEGPRGIAGEWGHNPLPWPAPEEYPGPECWCGRRGCLETWVSGPGLASDYFRTTGRSRSGEDIVAAAATDDAARAALERHAGRLARGLAQVINVFDPHVIVLGGGLSQLTHLYDVLPGLIAPHVFCDHANIDVRRPRWGDASGVRGAARLWT